MKWRILRLARSQGDHILIMMMKNKMFVRRELFFWATITIFEERNLVFFFFCVFDLEFVFGAG